MGGEEVEVKTYSGYTYAERPVAFSRGGQAYQIDRILKTWREPNEIHFRVEAQDNLFHLCYNEVLNQWSLVAHRRERDA